MGCHLTSTDFARSQNKEFWINLREQYNDNSELYLCSASREFRWMWADEITKGYLIGMAYEIIAAGEDFNFKTGTSYLFVAKDPDLPNFKKREIRIKFLDHMINSTR